jgi:hypothetical protein
MSPSFSFIKPVSPPLVKKTKASQSAPFTYTRSKAVSLEPQTQSRMTSVKT